MMEDDRSRYLAIELDEKFFLAENPKINISFSGDENLIKSVLLSIMDFAEQMRKEYHSYVFFYLVDYYLVEKILVKSGKPTNLSRVVIEKNSSTKHHLYANGNKIIFESSDLYHYKIDMGIIGSVEVSFEKNPESNYRYYLSKLKSLLGCDYLSIMTLYDRKNLFGVSTNSPLPRYYYFDYGSCNSLNYGYFQSRSMVISPFSSIRIPKNLCFYSILTLKDLYETLENLIKKPKALEEIIKEDLTLIFSSILLVASNEVWKNPEIIFTVLLAVVLALFFIYFWYDAFEPETEKKRCKWKLGIFILLIILLFLFPSPFRTVVLVTWVPALLFR